MTAYLDTLLKRPSVAKLMRLLNDETEETRLVGGALRDSFLGLPVSEIDFATTLKPEAVMARAKAAKLHTVPVGLSHGTVLIVIDGEPFEITTLREDVKTDGRHAEVAFGRDFEADAMRRDFTINAFSLSQDGVLHDYVDGLADLRACRVRFIGDPVVRIKEDYLRIMRFFRFSAKLSGGHLDAAGLAASIHAQAGLAKLSRERIRMELLRLLAAPYAPDVLQIMSECGIAQRVLEGVAYPRALQILVQDKLEPAGAEVLLRLAAYAVRVGEDAERLTRALRLSKSEAARLLQAAHVLELLQSAPHDWSCSRLRALIFNFGRATVLDGVRLFYVHQAQCPCEPCQTTDLLERVAFTTQTPELIMPVRGEDFRQAGLNAGPLIGKALAHFRQAWILADFPTEATQISSLMDGALQNALQHAKDHG